MIVFSYGIPKSGSTLAYQLAAGVAALGGHWQPCHWPELRMPGRFVMPARGLDPASKPIRAWSPKTHLMTLAFQFAARRTPPGPEMPPDLRPLSGRALFLETLRPEDLHRLVALTGDRILLVKTHGEPSPEWMATYREFAARGLVRAHVNHRDPRDICLALMDAARLHRVFGLAEFSEYEQLEQAVAGVDRHLKELALWCELPRILHLDYDTCAFRPHQAIDLIKADLGLRAPNALVRHYATRLAFTQRNKAVADRHRRELDHRQVARMTEAFLPYLRQTGYLAGRPAIRPEIFAKTGPAARAQAWPPPPAAERDATRPTPPA
ncbi:hypothetical protein [Sediminicoccus sp. KRV36]|uniref:hypothetical protein n=1 Tax=Sediminicoccus sp. KRV36 TaxID=3133721 RepID=UPI00200BD1B5|nr:hypothetical protein [Sediminicoccus rosea]UPY37522.1 hypothetical protein LHU95_02195 [Sediminicoccus rosea]